MLQKLLQNAKIREACRFALVGGVATLLQFLVYYMLAGIASHNVALPISYLVSLCLNFLMTTYFTFQVKPDTKKGLGFLASHGLNFALQFLLLNFLVWTGMDKQWAIIPVFLICIPVNFILVRLSMKRL